MAKGFGAIMAEVALAEKKWLLESADTVLCPLCGGIMTNDGAGWFCYQAGTPNDSKCPQAVLRGWLYDDSIQGQVLAIVADQESDPPVILAECRAVRGGGGRTNIRVSAVEFGRDAEVPEWISKHGWVRNEELLGS